MAKVYLSPSDQRANTYAYGDTTEAVQCGYIAEACKAALERSGVEVKLGHYMTMTDKCRESNEFKADIHCPIHTNAYNGVVMGTRIFSYDTKGKGWQYAQEVFKVLAPITPGTSENVKAAPQLFEVATPKAPTVYVECEFHDAPDGAKWIVEHTTEIGEAIAEGLCNALGVTFVKADTDYVPYAEYEDLKEKYNILNACADAFYQRVKEAVRIYEQGV